MGGGRIWMKNENFIKLIGPVLIIVCHVFLSPSMDRFSLRFEEVFCFFSSFFYRKFDSSAAKCESDERPVKFDVCDAVVAAIAHPSTQDSAC